MATRAPEGVYEIPNPEEAYAKANVIEPSVLMNSILGNKGRTFAEAFEPSTHYQSYSGKYETQEKIGTDFNIHTDNASSVGYTLFSGPIGLFMGVSGDIGDNPYAKSIYGEVMARANAAGEFVVAYMKELKTAEDKGKAEEKAAAKEIKDKEKAEAATNAEVRYVIDCGNDHVITAEETMKRLEGFKEFDLAKYWHPYVVQERENDSQNGGP